MRRRALLQSGEIDYSKRYLTFTALESGTFSLRVPSGVSNYIRNVSYSTDNGATWTKIYISTAAKTITTPTIAVGSKVLWKANANALASSPSNFCHFEATGNFDVSGNILSLEYGDDFADKTSLKDYGYSMCKLFYENTKVKSAENLVLPATSLKIQCYSHMFYGCTGLTKAPELPATTLADYCYSYMFKGCTSLTTAPELPATTLASGCYRDMFNGCTSLATAPELTAITLTDSCYYSMFSGCTSLTTTPELPATTLANSCYYSMFYYCISLTTAPELPATTLANSCYRNMFYYCISLTTAPELPATTLENFCYFAMFKECYRLTTAPILPAMELTMYCYGNMFLKCYRLNSITCLARDISASGCTEAWVSGVSATGTFVKASSSVSWETGTSGIPSGWSVDSFYDKKYLTIVSESNGNTIGLRASSSTIQKTISVSTDGGSTWNSKTSSTGGTVLATLNKGEKLLIKGSNTAYSNTSYYNYFESTETFYVEGNIMSLLYGDNFVNQKSLSGKSYAFEHLFYQTKITNAENLILPATTLATYCYQNMFYNCTSLTTAPAILPATTAIGRCYYAMFYSCTSLTKAPIISATTLAKYCYHGMFYNCTSLTTAPELPATTLASSCYQNMFYNCTSLSSITCLATNISASNCTTNWVNGVAASGTFTKAASMSGWTTGNNGIPSGWTVKDYE